MPSFVVHAHGPWPHRPLCFLLSAKRWAQSRQALCAILNLREEVEDLLPVNWLGDDGEFVVRHDRLLNNL